MPARRHRCKRLPRPTGWLHGQSRLASAGLLPPAPRCARRHQYPARAAARGRQARPAGQPVRVRAGDSAAGARHRLALVWPGQAAASKRHLPSACCLCFQLHSRSVGTLAPGPAAPSGRRPRKAQHPARAPAAAGRAAPAGLQRRQKGIPNLDRENEGSCSRRRQQ